MHNRKRLTVICRAAIAVALLLILSFTLLNRTSEERDGASFALLAYIWPLKPWYLKELFLNMLLYLPFGVALACMLQGRLRIWQTILTSGFAGFGLSFAIEVTQQFTGLGCFEVDDVLCNTLGTLSGACCLLVAGLLDRICAHGRCGEDCQ